MAEKFRVVILGGGSAGWMTAAYLSKALEHGVEISVIESENIGTIGVGEATFSTVQLFFSFLGLKERDWMPHCNASYKVGIKFVDWNAERRHFYHPFQRFDIVQGRSIAEWWLKLKRGSAPFDYACFTIPKFCDARKAPRYMDGHVFDSKVDGVLTSDHPDQPLLLDDLQIQYPYAYHFDASLVAKFMMGYACKRGVTQIQDDVTDVHRAENGDIASLQTKAHGKVAADLFVDCTGFRGLLINKVLEEPFISFSESLLCDRAVALRVPSDPKTEGINPYTSATALSSGWVWNIPLFHRVGTGYVYSSAFLTAEEAEREFRAHLGKRAEGCTASHIKMRIGRNRNSWVRNVVAIGLSSGFVEPLESTGIFFIQHGIEQLVSHFPRKVRDEQNIKSYNAAIADCIDGVREFLTLHYVASSRNDTPFWKATKTDIMVPDALAERMALWKTTLPTNRTINQRYHGFEAYSYCVMLLGLGWIPNGNLAVLDHMEDARASLAFEAIRSRADYLTSTLPSQYEYLASQYKSAEERGLVATASSRAS
jgi:tryptophan 6-halogenase